MSHPTSPLPIRKILHIDMDAFFASVEQRDNASLRGKPVAVGGSRERGVVAAASYEARTFGVRSAMSSRRALQLCPDLIFVKPRFPMYREVSHQIRGIFLEYTDLVEPLSLDEAYLDVTVNKPGIASALRIAKEIKGRIKTETGLTASAGVSINKFIAKIASDYQKPDGLTVVMPEHAADFVAQLPVDKFYGVGKVTARKMHELGIHTGLELKERTEAELVRHFGKVGHFYYRIARGIDDRPVDPNRIRKSIGSETTFDRDLEDPERIREELEKIAADVLGRLMQHGHSGCTLTLKVKFSDFEQITRSRTVAYSLNNTERILTLTNRLIEEVPWNKSVRLLGLSVSGLDQSSDSAGIGPGGQLRLFV